MWLQRSTHRGLQAASANGGSTREQATTAANALAEALSIEIATKAGLKALRLQIEGKLSELRLQLGGEIAELDRKISETRLGLESKISETRFGSEGKIAEARTEILKWTIGMIGFQTLAVVGALFAMLKMFLK